MISEGSGILWLTSLGVNILDDFVLELIKSSLGFVHCSLGCPVLWHSSIVRAGSFLEGSLVSLILRSESGFFPWDWSRLEFVIRHDEAAEVVEVLEVAGIVVVVYIQNVRAAGSARLTWTMSTPRGR